MINNSSNNTNLSALLDYMSLHKENKEREYKQVCVSLGSDSGLIYDLYVPGLIDLFHVSSNFYLLKSFLSRYEQDKETEEMCVYLEL